MFLVTRDSVQAQVSRGYSLTWLLIAPCTGTNVEEFDPAFRELVQTSNSSGSNDVGEEDGEDKGDIESSGDEKEGGVDGDDTADVPTSGAEDSNNELTETWITSVYEELTEQGSSSSNQAGKCVLAAVSVGVGAHRVQCAAFSGPLAQQDFAEYLDLLKVNLLAVL